MKISQETHFIILENFIMLFFPDLHYLNMALSLVYNLECFNHL